MTDEAIDKLIDILNEVKEERKQQHRRWGEQNHAPAPYSVILNEEVCEVNQLVCDYTFTDGGTKDKAWLARNLREELVQVAAVAVQWIEALDRNELDNEID